MKTAAIATSNDFNKSSLLFQGQHMDAGSDNILDSMRGKGNYHQLARSVVYYLKRGIFFKGGRENNKHFLSWREKVHMRKI